MVLEGRRLGEGRRGSGSSITCMRGCAQAAAVLSRAGKLPATEAVHYSKGIRSARAPSAGQLQRSARRARPRYHQPTQEQLSPRCSTHLGQGVEEVQGGLRMQLGARTEERHGGQTAGWSAAASTGGGETEAWADGWLQLRDRGSGAGVVRTEGGQPWPVSQEWLWCGAREGVEGEPESEADGSAGAVGRSWQKARNRRGAAPGPIAAGCAPMAGPALRPSDTA